jgi:PAS domain S-box-containing protein
MKNENKSKDQLINELVELRQRIAELKASETDYKQMKETLLESEEKFRTFMETASDLIYIMDKDGKTRSLGYSKEEMIGMHITQLISKETLGKFGTKREEIIEKGKITHESIWKKRDGKEIYGENKIVAFYDSDGKYAGVRCVFRDMTERKKADDDLKENEEKLRTFIESASDLMYETDADGNFIYVNEALAINLGYTKEEVIGMHLSGIASKEDLERYNVQEEELIAKGKLTFEPILIRKDGEKIHGEIKIVALYDSDGRYAGSRGIFRDISERKKMEEEKENLIEKLQEALARIKTLRGLLPICSSCKKIRDDKGYWHQVEIYIQDHSEAEFTHGFCPECLNVYLSKLNKDN